MNKGEKEFDAQLREMLDNIFTQADFKNLAKNRGITTKGIDKGGLVELVAERCFIPENLTEI